MIWIATDEGLVKKDGAQWTVYNSANAPLIHNGIRNIALDSNGHVWVNNSSARTGLAALFEFDGHTWHKFTVGEELPWEPPEYGLGGLFVDSRDHVWVGHELLGGVAVYDGATWTLLAEDLAQFDEMAEDAEGNVWLIGAYTYRYDGANFIEHRHMTGGATGLTVDDTGRIWTSSFRGEVYYSDDRGGSWRFFTQAPTAIYSIAPNPAGTDVFITSIGAVRHHDRFGTWLEAFNSYNTGVPDYFLTHELYQDRDGYMWAVSDEAGVSRFDGQRWMNFGSHNPNREWIPASDGASGIYQDRRGDIWIGGNGILRWDGESFDYWNCCFSPFPTSFFGEDVNGTPWGVGGSQLFRFDGADWHFARQMNGLVIDILNDGAGRMWVLCDWDLQMWDGENWTMYDDGPLFDLGGSNDLAIGPGDEIWIASDGGLVRFVDGEWIVYDQDNSPMPALQVLGVDVRDDGVIGLTSHTFQAQTPFPNGVVLIDGDIDDPDNWTIHRYEDTPLPHYQLGDAQFDVEGNLRVSSISEGLAIVSVPTSGGCVRDPAWVCDGDVDGDGQVNPVDAGLVQAAFGSVDPQDLCNYDTDCDGQINPVDAGIVQALFGTCDPPRSVCP